MDPVFLLTASISIAASVAMVVQRNPVYSAVCLLVAFMSFAVLFLNLGAVFLAAIHVLVYTGAILVLFVFVIMLLNLKKEELGEEYPLEERLVRAVLCAGMFVLLALPISRDGALAKMPPPVKDDFGSVESVGRILFEQYALPFELVSLLIVVAMFGAMVLAKKRMWNTEGPA